MCCQNGIGLWMCPVYQIINITVMFPFNVVQQQTGHISSSGTVAIEPCSPSSLTLWKRGCETIPLMTTSDMDAFIVGKVSDKPN